MCQWPLLTSNLSAINVILRSKKEIKKTNKKIPVTKPTCKDVLKKNEIRIQAMLADVNQQMNKTVSDF